MTGLASMRAERQVREAAERGGPVTISRLPGYLSTDGLTDERALAVDDAALRDAGLPSLRALVGEEPDAA